MTVKHALQFLWNKSKLRILSISRIFIIDSNHYDKKINLSSIRAECVGSSHERAHTSPFRIVVYLPSVESIHRLLRGLALAPVYNEKTDLACSSASLKVRQAKSLA